MGVFVNVGLMRVFSLSILMGRVPVLDRGMVVLVRVRRDEMLDFTTGTSAAVMRNMDVFVAMHEIPVRVRLEWLSCHFAPPSDTASAAWF